jgi:3-hydroxyacyl-CoA dehydrogenase
MRIGILGSGLMGGKLGALFACSGHDLVFSYARSADKLKRLTPHSNTLAVGRAARRVEFQASCGSTVAANSRDYSRDRHAANGRKSAASARVAGDHTL